MVKQKKEKGKFEVRGIHKPIIAAGDLTHAGSGLWFRRSRSYMFSKSKADEIAGRMEANLAEKDIIDIEKRRGGFEIRVEPDSINAMTSPHPHGEAGGPTLEAAPEAAQMLKTKPMPVYGQSRDRGARNDAPALPRLV